MSDQQVVVYTAIFGDYDHPPNVRYASPDVEFVLVSDVGIEKPPWRSLRLTPSWTDLKLATGFVKTHPEQFTSSGSVSVWVDANLNDLVVDSAEIRSLARTSSIHAMPHRLRETVREEAVEVVALGLDSSDRVEALMDEQRQAGVPDDLALSACGLVIRNLDDTRVGAMNAQWWEWIINGSRRDQLSFNAACWLSQLEVNHLDVDWRVPNHWFHRIPHAKPKGRVSFDSSA